MKRILPFVALALALVATTLSAGEPPETLAGAWTLVSVANLLPDGTRTEPYGPGPQGLLLLDADGRYSLQIFRAGRAGFASGDKNRGTAEEYKATVEGTNSHYGRYAVDPAGDVITFRIEHASFPNWVGTEQKRSFTSTGNELRYSVPATTNGAGVTGEVVWRRAGPRR